MISAVRITKVDDLKTFAIFDLDYTLTKRGTWGRFVWKSVKSRPYLWGPLLVSTIVFIVLASAAVDLVVEPIAQKLGITDFVATELSWCGENQLMSEFASPNCYGTAKLDRVKTLLSKMVTDEPYRVVFYSDSKALLLILPPNLKLMRKAINCLFSIGLKTKVGSKS